MLHRGHEVLEEVEPLALVLDERVTLPHGSKADPGSQVVHLGEVLPPAVDGLDALDVNWRVKHL